MVKRSSIGVVCVALAVIGAISLPGVTLPAGTYVFELADPSASIDVVRVSSKDRKQVYFAGFTERVPRPSGWPANRPVSLGESLHGIPPAVLAWYPNGDPIGRRFIYNQQ